MPQAAVCGILNGMDPALRTLPVPDSIEALVEAKTAAKLAFQEAQGLEVRVADVCVRWCGCRGLNGDQHARRLATPPCRALAWQRRPAQ